MYGAHLSFSDVLLPGAGGAINASNAMTTDRLAQLNKSGKKWSPDASGGMSHHNEAILTMNAQNRAKRANLVNRNYNESCDGKAAMKEIMDRKKSRMASFKELKANEYPFGERDADVLSAPLPAMSMGECKCGGKCPACRQKIRQEAEYREWDTEKRKELKSGKFEGEFAGPGMSFPISSPQDVAAAWSSVGRGKNPRQIMANIIRIAKKHGWESGLPESVKQRLKEGKSGLPE